MNPHLSRIALRPRGPFEVFDLTLRFLRERPRAFSVLAAWMVLPPAVLLGALAWWSSGSWWVLVPTLLLTFVVQAPFTVLGGRLLFAEDASVRQAMGATARSAGGLFIAWFLELLGLALVCSGFGIVALPVLLYLPETALLERVDVGRGLRRSMRLASGHLGVAVVGVVARFALTLWGALLGELSGQALVGFVLQLGEPFGSLAAGQLTPYAVLGILGVQPLIAVYRLLLYVDVRTRMEGWDLQVGLRALGLGTKP